MRPLLALYLIIVICSISYGQVIQDSFYRLPRYKHRPLVSALEGLASNIIVNRYNANIVGHDWAKVSPQNWYQNLHDGFKSDGDEFGTNFFGHPYQGSLYFNAARSQGSSFWGAVPYVLVGSWTWEFFGEKESPSEIDWNTTTFGGIYLGEITFRLANQLLRSNRLRKYKVARNTLATVINPLLQFNNLLYPDVRNKLYSDQSHDFPIRSQISGGIAHLINSPKQFINRNYFHLDFSLVYGDFFDDSFKYKPFDYFELSTWLDLSTFGSLEKNYLSMTSNAPLWRLFSNDFHTFSITNHYDFMHNPIFKIGAISISADYHYSPKVSWAQLRTSLKAGPIIFGSSKSEVVEMYFEELGNEIGFRDYVYGKGLMCEANVYFDMQHFGRIQSAMNYWGIVIQRDTKGFEQNGTFRFEYFYPLFNNFGLGMEYFLYKRIAHYDEFDEFNTIRNQYSEIKLLSYLTF